MAVRNDSVTPRHKAATRIDELGHPPGRGQARPEYGQANDRAQDQLITTINAVHAPRSSSRIGDALCRTDPKAAGYTH